MKRSIPGAREERCRFAQKIPLFLQAVVLPLQGCQLLVPGHALAQEGLRSGCLQLPLPARDHVRIDIELAPDLGLGAARLVRQGKCFAFKLRRVFSSSWHDAPPRPLSAFSKASAISG